MRNAGNDVTVEPNDPIAGRMPWASLELTFDRSSGVPAHVWRSAIGRVLRHAVCLTRADSCAGCPLRERCAYPAWFEPDSPGSPPPLNAAESAPAPYALHVPHSGMEATRLRLLVVGERALSESVLMVRAVEQAGREGLGNRRECLALRKISAVANAAGRTRLSVDVECDEAVMPATPDAVIMNFESPVRILRAKKLVEPTFFDSALLMDALRRRFALLSWAHAETLVFDVPERRIDMVKRDLRLVGRQRYSARQGRKLSLAGLVGQAQLEGPGLAALWPWLWVGQYIHIGKATTQGAGAYRLLRPL